MNGIDTYRCRAVCTVKHRRQGGCGFTTIRLIGNERNSNCKTSIAEIKKSLVKK